MCKLFLFFTVFVTFITPGFADNANAVVLFREANDLFARAGETADVATASELYTAAARRYEKLLAAPAADYDISKLYYNLGNCYFRLNDLGNAILAYRRAENFDPHYLPLQRNLALARTQCSTYLPPVDDVGIARILWFFHYDFSLQTRRLVALTTFVIFWLLLLACRIFPKLSGNYAAIFGGLAILFFASLAYQDWEKAREANGVILAPEVVAKQGDGNNYAAAFQQPLQAGTEFRLREKRRDWWQIVLPDARDCWIPANTAALVL